MGKILIFESIFECSEYFNVERSAIRYRLKHSKQIRIRVDWLKGGTIEYI